MTMTVVRFQRPSTEYCVFCPAFETDEEGMPNV